MLIKFLPQYNPNPSQKNSYIKKQKIYNKKKVQKMQQLKQIILSRINDIKQLQILQSESNINSKNRYHTILMQRYGEQSRNSRQTEILALCIRQPEILNPQELFGFAKYICALYDPSLESKQQGDIKNRLYLLLRSFFSKHDLHQKLPTLKSIFGKNTNKIYVYPVLHLLSQWSKKRYLKILSIQIKSMKKQNPYQTLDSQSPSHTQCQKSNQCSPIQSQNKIINRINSMRSDMATNQRQDKKKKQNESSINSGKILTIYNKTTLYSYFSIQLDQYYNLTGIQNLDIFYIKTLCKRKMKDHLLLPQNINRAVNILIDSSNNKEIKNHVNNWMTKNQQYKQSDRYKTKLLKCDTKNLITPINQQEVDDKKYKKLSLDIKSQETHEIPKIERSVQLSRKKIKDNSILLERTKEQVYESMRDIAQKSSISKIRYHKKLEQLKVEDNQENITSQNHHQNNKNKLKLPSLSRSMQKQSNQDDNKKIIRFSTQEQEILQDQPKHEEKQLPRFKFIQRQTIKGIIIKNFLSNRQKNKKNHIKKIQCKSARKQSEEILNNLEQKKKNVESQPRKITDCVDIRSLRQKTRALLRNFNTIQNYLS